MNRMLLWLNILLAAGAAGLAARAVATAVRPLPQPQAAAMAPAASTPLPRAEALKPLGAYAAIAERDLFRIGDQETAAPPSVDVAALDRTRLALKLWGTISADDGPAYAVIEDPKLRQQDLYRAGDVIQGAQVKMILREKVVLSVNNRDEVLLMEENGRTGTASEPIRTIQPPKPNPVQPPLPETETESDAGDDRMPVQRVTLDAQSLAAMTENPDEMLNQVRFRVHTEENQPAGLLLTGIRPDSVLRKMGLRSGDLITASDEGAVDSPEALTAVVERLSSASTLSLELRRRGKPTSLEITVK